MLAPGKRSPLPPRGSPLGSYDAAPATWTASALRVPPSRRRSRYWTWIDSGSAVEDGQVIQIHAPQRPAGCVGALSGPPAPGRGHGSRPIGPLARQGSLTASDARCQDRDPVAGKVRQPGPAAGEDDDDGRQRPLHLRACTRCPVLVGGGELEA